MTHCTHKENLGEVKELIDASIYAGFLRRFSYVMVNTYRWVDYVQDGGGVDAIN